LLFTVAQQSQGNNFQQIFQQLSHVSSWAGSHFRATSGMSKEEREKANDPITQIMLVNALARDRGIEVALGEVKDWLEKVFTNADQYQRACMFIGLKVPQFEAVLREGMLFRRAMDLSLAQTPLPSGENLVDEWRRRNERVTFEVAAFSVEDRKKGMDAAKITDEELKKWLDARKDPEKEKYKESEKIQLEGLAVADPIPAKFNDAFQALVNAVTLEANDAQAFFDMSRADRYKKPASAPAESKASTAPETLPSFFAFDEVKDRVMMEVKVARALDKVRAEAIEASNKEKFDLKAIGDKYGLAYWTSGDPATTTAVLATEKFGTAAWRAPLETAKEGEFLPGTQAASGAIEFTRVKRKVEPRIPEVKDIRATLLVDYLDQKSDERAKDDANQFKDAVIGAEGADRFARIGKEKGVETKVLAPISRDRRNDPDYSMNPDTKDPAHFLAGLHYEGSPMPSNPRIDPFMLKKDAVGGPYHDAANKIYYVVHLVDSVPPAKTDMMAADYLTFRDRFLKELREKRCMEIMSSDSLQKLMKIESHTKKEEATPQ
jgi:hypothetical protein